MATTYKIPERAIFSEADMRKFITSDAYKRHLVFIKHLNESVKGIKLTDEFPVSENIQAICDLLGLLNTWIDEIPPIAQPMRFGNKAFRDWYDRLAQEAPTLHANLLKPMELQEASLELSPYLIDSFGNRTRIDYGTGHESNFILWICALHKVGFIAQSDFTAVVLKVFHTYLTLMRRLQKTYMLEPAGSHGVWGLDDYQCLPFYFGSSQLIGQSELVPSCVHDDNILAAYSKDYLYLDAVKFVRDVKSASTFAETSPMLNDISGVHSWEKINSGMLKLYEGEVMKKLPVIQHMLFGTLIPCSWVPSQSGDSSYTPVSTAQVRAANASWDTMGRAPWAATANNLSATTDTPELAEIVTISERLLQYCYMRDSALIASLSSYLVHEPLASLSVTKDEISLVLPASIVLPKEPSVTENGWTCFKVEGPLDFALTGILSALTQPLAVAGIPVFAISTYDTDYILVKQDKAENTIQVWTEQQVAVVTRVGEMIAVKQLKIQDSSIENSDTTCSTQQELPLSKIEHELNIGLSLCHPHIMQYLGAQQQNNIYYIFMEYLPIGSISSLLKTIGPLDESIICVYIAQLLRGLNYLHTIGIAHRDIKCANLLLSDSGCLKIADFGTAKKTSISCTKEDENEFFATISSVREGIGTPFWMSPEIIRAEFGQDAWKKSDIWSVGCCVIEMATGEPPWKNFSNPLTAMFHIASATTIPTFPEHLSTVACDFLSSCFIKDPTLRPTAADLLHCPFFHKLPRSSSHYGWFTKEKPTPPQPPPPHEEDYGNWFLYFDYINNSYEYAYYVLGDGGHWFYRSNCSWEWLPFVSEVVYEISIWWLHKAKSSLSEVVNEFLPSDTIEGSNITDSVYTMTTPLHFSSQNELFHEEIPNNNITTTYVRALADYVTSEPGELALREHDVLIVYEMDPNGWWHGCNTNDPNVNGWFPCTYVEWLNKQTESDSTIGMARMVNEYYDESNTYQLGVNELVQVFEMVDEQWLRVQSINFGITGWCPVNCVEWLPCVHAAWAYERSHNEELTLQPGDFIYVLGYDQNSSVWWEGYNLTTKQQGWFPSSHVQSENQIENASIDGDEEVVVVDEDSLIV
ncbi:serine/threonine-protein phosphatase 2A regulatory subunit B' [Thraustotheca clavata]|uniref:peptidylprolyl isomerase n=1 Tax=Thraustotheca clavata TaxID=74557 RepID=A0A1V9ZP55_9STRA|nr:serine/threonine-protein phosphatase 2A regulatory subunit B' [Thraustotheca clavata]